MNIFVDNVSPFLQSDRAFGLMVAPTCIYVWRVSFVEQLLLYEMILVDEYGHNIIQNVLAHLNG